MGNALASLLDGNRRFSAGISARLHQDAARRAEVAAGQHPAVAILCCSDSRVPPEIIFDQGIGDLFVVRNAGNIADDTAVESLEYAVEHLGVSLLLVLGHSSCGAVTAALTADLAQETPGGIIETIRRSVAVTPEEERGDVDAVARAHAREMVREIAQRSEKVAERMRSGELLAAAGWYDLSSGVVTLFS